jgi:hypothetical protein
LRHDLFGAGVKPYARTAVAASHKMKKHYAAVLPIALLWVSEALAQVPTPVTNTDFSNFVVGHHP